MVIVKIFQLLYTYIVIFVIEIIIASMRVDFMRRNQIETCNERCRVFMFGMEDKYVGNKILNI